MIRLRHKLIRDITNRLESFSLNTVISGFMEYNNKLHDAAKKSGGIDKETIESYIQLLAPFAPHIAEELWSDCGHEESVFIRGKDGRSITKSCAGMMRLRSAFR